MVSINSLPNIAIKTSDNTKIKLDNTSKIENKTNIAIASDKVDVKKGMNPTLKGAAAGALGVSAIAVTFFTATGAFKQEGGMLAVPLVIGGALAGGIGGAIGSTGSSKMSGTLRATAVGAVAGGLLGVASKDVGQAVVGAIAVGTIIGAGGFFGSLTTKQK